MENSRYILLSFLLNEYVRIIEGGLPLLFYCMAKTRETRIETHIELPAIQRQAVSSRLALSSMKPDH
ncbi:hypothetical protein GT2_01_02460 [Parageobacillus thermoglucosidasius NBRC 107763]|nr:hypothetical protein GT2_01_02460 [Parageobacillus thermoglucosidasius NBRC 107763]